MAGNCETRPLKVCYTCRYWTYTYKGLCTRLNQGVGKFWICEDWTGADDLPSAGTPKEAASGSDSPHG